MTCPYGVIGEIYDYGVNNAVSGGVSGLTCSSTAANQACKPNNQNLIDQVFGSVGQDSFSVHFNPANLWTSANSECNQPRNTVFISYSCVNTPAQQDAKYRQMCWVVLIGSMNAFVFVCFLRYQFFDNQFTKDEWDLSTITVGDYSVELPLKQEAIVKWSENGYLKNYKQKGIAFNYALKQHLGKKIIKYLNEFHAQEENEHSHSSKVKRRRTAAKHHGIDLEKLRKKHHGHHLIEICDIRFTYQNREMIDLLTKRGKAISKGKFDDIKDINQEIIYKIELDDEQKFSVPNACFITFHTPIGADTALDSN
jgi:hypothetical protein